MKLQPPGIWLTTVSVDVAVELSDIKKPTTAVHKNVCLDNASRKGFKIGPLFEKDQKTKHEIDPSIPANVISNQHRNSASIELCSENYNMHITM